MSGVQDPMSTALTDTSERAEREAAPDALVQNMERIAAETLDRWQSEVEKRLAGPVRTAATAAGERHEALVRRTLLETTLSRLAQADAYRRATLEQVLEPLAQVLASTEADILLQGVEALIEAASSVAADAPQYCVLPLAALDSRSPHARRRRIRQRIARWLRGLKALAHRLARTPRAAPSRRVPLRALLQYHAQVRIAQTLAVIHERWELHVANVAARLETGITDWMHAVLEFEHEAEGPVAPFVPFTAFVRGQPLDTKTPDPPNTLLKASEALQETLAATAADTELPQVGAVLTQDADLLRSDLEIAGTVLLRHSERRFPRRMPGVRVRRLRQRWAAWHEQTRNRIELCLLMARLRGLLVDQRHALLQNAADAALAPVLQAFEPATELLADPFGPDSDGFAETLPRNLEALRERVLEPVRNSLAEPAGVDDTIRNLSGPGGSQWLALQEALSGWPESAVLHALPRAGAVIVPRYRLERRFVQRDLQRLLSPLPECLAKSAGPLRRQLRRAWRKAQHVVSVVEFSLATAMQELEASSGSESAHKARTLVHEGLARASSTLQDLLNSLEEPWQEFTDGVWTLLRRDWWDIHRSVRAETPASYHRLMLVLLLERNMQELGRWTRTRFQDLREWVAHFFHRGRRQAAALIEQGRTAIGAVQTTEDERRRALDTLGPAAMRQLHGRLPLVYRKLFDLEAIAEPWLLAGRGADLTYLQGHVERWLHRRSGAPLMLPMQPGSGRTSLLRGLEARLDGSVSMATLDRRPTSATELASTLSAAMGAAAQSFEELEAWLLNSAPRVCLIDNLEHLVLRTYGGTKLMQRALLFFSQTETRVCWIATVNSFAWQYLDSVLGTTAHLAAAYEVSQSSRETIDKIMMKRHRRSGLRLHFGQPAGGTPILARRLRRARNERVRQTLLRDHFFEWLHHQCGTNVMLALAGWLQAAQFDSGAVTLEEATPLSFEFLKTFDLAHCFTLKAFLMHNTLTKAEYDRLFPAATDENTSVLQSLLNLDMIVPSGVSLTRLDSAPNSIRPDTRYRLHPLLVHPVSVLLKQQNIIH